MELLLVYLMAAVYLSLDIFIFLKKRFDHHQLILSLLGWTFLYICYVNCPVS